MSKQNTNLVDKLKTALQRLLKWTEAHTGIYSIRVCPKKDDPDKVAKEKVRAIALAHKALELPLRNCDVGTVDEQYERMKNFCDSHIQRISDSSFVCNCPCKDQTCKCELTWAQLPYEESDGVSK